MNSQLTKPEKAKIKHKTTYKKRKKFTLPMLFNKLFQDKIQHLEGKLNYTTIHFTNGETQESAYSLSIFTTILQPHNFIRIHRKYLINSTNIKSIQENEVQLINGNILQASRRKAYTLKQKSNEV